MLRSERARRRDDVRRDRGQTGRNAVVRPDQIGPESGAALSPQNRPRIESLRVRPQLVGGQPRVGQETRRYSRCARMDRQQWSRFKNFS